MRISWVLPLLVIMGAAGMAAQNFSLYRVISANNSGANPVTDHQVLVKLDTSNFNYANVNGANGEDIRFFGLGGTPALDYFIETWNPAGTSLIWVKIPSIPANGATDFEMHYEDAGTTTSASNFAATYPSSFISSGSTTLTGVQSFDWFEVGAADTITVGAGSVLEIRARRIIIQGNIDGSGAGNLGATSPGTGGGLGGGAQAPSASGAGGGGYGGDGGDGGADGADVPGAGGTAYGSSDSVSIDMGSGGGCTAAAGGNGGGGVDIRGFLVTISGSINCNGAQSASGGQGGGGGSGGGILIGGYDVETSGTFDANGGDAGAGSGGNDDGGGGGGGRIKILWEDVVNDTSVQNVAGGLSGLGTSTAPGQPGDPGSTHVSQETAVIAEVFAVIGAETLFNAEASAAPAAGSSLAGPMNGPFALSVDPGSTLANAEIELTDGDADPIDVLAITPLTSVPAGITAPVAPANPAHPVLLAWTGTADASNPPGDYTWEIEFADTVNLTTVIIEVTITINDLPPTHVLLDAMSGDGSSGNPYTVNYFPGATGALAVDLATVTDPNTSQPVTLTGVVQVSGPSSGTGFQFSLSAGVLNIAPAGTLVQDDAGNQAFTLVVEDGTHTELIRVDAFVFGSSGNMFFVNSPVMPFATIDMPYGPETLIVQGGTTPYTFNEISGTWPAGITLNTATGEISGTPTELGTFSVEIRVIDANNDTVTETFTLTVRQEVSEAGGTTTTTENNGCSSTPGSTSLLLLALLAGLAGLRYARYALES